MNNLNNFSMFFLGLGLICTNVTSYLLSKRIDFLKEEVRKLDNQLMFFRILHPLPSPVVGSEPLIYAPKLE